ncbi:MAG TPA: molybdenum cofactor guanylyltransferase [Dehalococcoidia bacterium]|nr:molybdenum cofactor guanylyltransferase [Dehalococcoidia bacterium]
MSDATLRAAAIVLAGGRSTRLGRDKASEVLLGRTLLQRVLDRLDGLVDEWLIVKAVGQRLPPVVTTPAAKVIEDAYPGSGPLGGLYSGLAAMRAPFAIAVACDMPLLQPRLIAELLRLAPGHGAVVPLHDGLPEPLCAVYSRDCAAIIRAHLEAGRLKLTGFLDEIDTLYVKPDVWREFDPEGLSFLNVNREADLARAARVLAAGAGDA